MRQVSINKLFLLLIFFFSNVCATGFCNVNRLKQTLTELKPHLAGHFIVLVSSPEVSFQWASSQVDENSQFYIGSVTKHMTAYMLLTILHKLYPQSEIEVLLNMKLNALFPTSKLLRKINKNWVAHVSLLDLLTHRSGLTDYLDSYNNGLNPPEALNKPIGAIKLLRSVAFNPKGKYLYSNTNYLLIGKLIEEISLDSFDHVFEKVIKIPANMLNTFAPVSGYYFDFKKDRAYFRLVPNVDKKVFMDMSNAVGSGNVIATIADLKRWGHYLFQKAPKVIVDAMLKNYGLDPDGDIINLGLGTTDTCLGPFVGHQGEIDSYNSFWGYAPNDNRLILILSNNKNDAEKLMETVIKGLLQRNKGKHSQGTVCCEKCS